MLPMTSARPLSRRRSAARRALEFNGAAFDSIPRIVAGAQSPVRPRPDGRLPLHQELRTQAPVAGSVLLRTKGSSLGAGLP